MTRIAIIRFPGASDAGVISELFERVFEQEARLVPHSQERLDDFDGIVIPGGSSYADYLRPGAIAARNPVMGGVRKAAESGKPVMGLGGGFQVLCEAGILPGTFLPNNGTRFFCGLAHIRIINPETPFTQFSRSELRLPVACRHGIYRLEEGELEQLESRGQVLFRFADEEGPPGGEGGVAGILNPRGNVLGLMAHPERAIDARTGSADGRYLIESFLGCVTTVGPRNPGP
jgi:phosphoribosylformylglycinamidine synthase